MTNQADGRRRLPRFFRRVFALGYYLLCAAFVFTVAFSVTYGAFRSYDKKSATAPIDIRPDDADGQKCIKDIEAALDQLHRRSRTTFAEAGARVSLRPWTDWSNNWRLSIRAIERHCLLRSSPTMKPVLEYAKDAERLHLGYDTAVRAYYKVAKKAAKRIVDRQKSASK